MTNTINFLGTNRCRKKKVSNFELRRCEKRSNLGYKIESRELSNTTSVILVSEYNTVHGRILAVNMAHIKKKREIAAKRAKDDNVFHRISEANSGEYFCFFFVLFCFV